MLYSLGFSVMHSAIFEAVTIQQIQTKSADSLALGRDKSDRVGDSVIVIGRVVAPPRVSPANNDLRTLLRGSNSWTCYIQDTANNLFGGMVVRQGSRGPQTLLDQLDTGQLVRLRGVVQEFPENGFTNPLTQIGLDTAIGYTVEPIGSPANRPAPKLVTIPDFNTGDPTAGGTINYVTGEKYEGMYVELRNVTVGPSLSNRHPWSIIDDQGNRLFFRDFSNFYTTDPANEIDTSYNHPITGTFINYIRGVIISSNNTDAQFGNQLPYCIVPIYRNDVSFGNAPPLISAPSRSPGVPTPADSVQVTCTVNDPASPIVSEARVFWRFNGGPFSNKVMNATGNIYSAKMPPAPLNTLVEYFIRAVDNQNSVRLLPIDTARSKLFYVVKASDSLTIQDVQFCPNNGGRSGFEGADVRGIEGIVTADTSDLPNFDCGAGCQGGNQTAPPRVIIQNGTGPNSGIWISGSTTSGLRRGDRVRVKGTVEENFSVTRISITSPANINVISTGNALPAPEVLTTSQLANSRFDGDTLNEKWESVFVRFGIPVTISCANAGTVNACNTAETLQDTSFRRNFGEIYVRDVSLVDARIELQDGNHSYTNNWNGVTSGLNLLTKNDIITFVQGIFYYSFGNYKMVPRKNDDFGIVTPVGISNHTEIIERYDLAQNYPNPFNPVTRINYNLPVNSKVMLKIYDVTGREIQSLVNGISDAGAYSVIFNGNNLASGVYFYKLTAEGTDGSSFVSTRRMVLVK